MSTKNTKKYCIHIFRRDYRLSDNTSLLKAISDNYIIIPVFIFTPVQIDNSKNKYKSHNCVKFLVESLQDLSSQCKKINSRLHIFYGDDINILKHILQSPLSNNITISALSFNSDYTAYSQSRDDTIKSLCDKYGIYLITLDDTLLQPLGTVYTGTGNNTKMYTKFTPYYRSAKQLPVPKPNQTHILSKHLLSSTSKITFNLPRNVTILSDKWSDIEKLCYDIDKIAPGNSNGSGSGSGSGSNSPILIEKAGRKAGLAKLSELGDWKKYGDCRDQLIYETTHLSAYLKFGCVSIREAYWNIRSKLGRTDSEPILRQLYWRDFFYNLSSTNPNIYKESLNKKRRDISWTRSDASVFKDWQNGNTGYPIVDSCMRELNSTGYMHNRGRLITSNFLVRLLHINWQEGERYFATHLYDYDPAQNNFGWQVSSAVSGTESRPISQTIYNPWLQAKKYDKDAVFIKKWCPELDSVPSSDLMNWDSNWNKWLDKGCELEGKYPEPIVDYKTEKNKDGKLFGY